MKKIIFFGLLVLSASLVSGQEVSLRTTEKAALKKLINTDTSVYNMWAAILRTADESLDATPNPADTILTEGILQGNPRKTKTWKSLEDMQKVYSLSLAYTVTGKSKYLAKTNSFLLAWAKGNTPTGNPINDTNLDRIIFAYDLVKANLTKTARTSITNWLNQVAIEEQKSYERAANGRGSTHFNNWNSHRIKVVAQIAWATGNDSLKFWTKAAYQRQIEKNLLPDGSSHDFHERDALHYHIYDVDPLLVTATILNRDSQKGNALSPDPYTYQSPTGSSLKKSIQWLIPFFIGTQTHAEWVNSKSAFDKKRAANGEKGYIAGTLFKPQEARTSIALAAYFEPQLLGIFQQHVGNKAQYPTWQFALNKIKAM